MIKISVGITSTDCAAASLLNQIRYKPGKVTVTLPLDHNMTIKVWKEIEHEGHPVLFLFIEFHRKQIQIFHRIPNAQAHPYWASLHYPDERQDAENHSLEEINSVNSSGHGSTALPKYVDTYVNA